MLRNVSTKNVASYSHWYTHVHTQGELAHKIEAMIIIIIIITIMNYKKWHDVINKCIVVNAVFEFH
jgi:hypothetical protein